MVLFLLTIKARRLAGLFKIGIASMKQIVSVDYCGRKTKDVNSVVLQNTMLQD